MRSTSWSTDTYRSQVSSQRLFKMSQDKQYIACVLSFAFLQIRFLHLMSFCFLDVNKHSQSFQPTPLIRRWTWAGRFPLLLLVVAGVSSRNLRAASQFVKSTLAALCTQQSVCVCVCGSACCLKGTMRGREEVEGRTTTCTQVFVDQLDEQHSLSASVRTVLLRQSVWDSDSLPNQS